MFTHGQSTSQGPQALWLWLFSPHPRLACTSAYTQAKYLQQRRNRSSAQILFSWKRCSSFLFEWPWTCIFTTQNGMEFFWAVYINAKKNLLLKTVYKVGSKLRAGSKDKETDYCFVFMNFTWLLPLAKCLEYTKQAVCYCFVPNVLFNECPYFINWGIMESSR